MTIKSFTVDPIIGNATISDVYGGTQINIQSSYELREVLQWWREWGPVFRSMNQTVQDSLQQARVLHELSKEQKPYPANSWTETTL